MPVELQVPVESADICRASIAKLVLHGLVIDHIDHWSHDVRLVCGYSAQQRLQPTCSRHCVLHSKYCIWQEPEPSIRRVWPSSLLTRSACAVLYAMFVPSICASMCCSKLNKSKISHCGTVLLKWSSSCVDKHYCNFGISFR